MIFGISAVRSIWLCSFRRKIEIVLDFWIAGTLHRIVKKFVYFDVSIHGNDVPFISLHYIFEVVVVIFDRKFHPFNLLLRSLFEVNQVFNGPPQLLPLLNCHSWWLSSLSCIHSNNWESESLVGCEYARRAFTYLLLLSSK